MKSDLEPVVKDVLHREQFRLPLIHLRLVWLDERRTLHRLRLHDVVVQQLLYVVDGRQY